MIKCKNCEEYKEQNEFRKNNLQCKTCLYNKNKCQHNKQKHLCLDCKGKSICEHNNRKYRCKECKGVGLCEHNKFKDYCKECKGRAFCEHDKQKNHCRECKGKSFCEHDKEKNQCRECSGKAYCEHNKRKHVCVVCFPKCACLDCKGVSVNKKSYYYPLCQACFCVKNPDHEKSTFYKLKEIYLRDELKVLFKDIDMIFDKPISGGCSLRKPDVLIDRLTHSIIIECDENQHSDYKCENKRIMQLFEDLGQRPIIVLRLNPDSYLSNNKEIVKGCFTPIKEPLKKRFYDINKREWNKRIKTLEKYIRYYIENIPSKEVTEIKLYYNYFS